MDSSILPFLKNKQSAVPGIMTIARKPDEHKEESNEDQGLMSAAKDLENAIKAGDHKGIVSALRAAFEMLDSEPHFEGPHTNESEE